MEENLKNLKTKYPNLVDFAKKVRSLYTHITINGKEIYLNKDFPNDQELGKFLESNV